MSPEAKLNIVEVVTREHGERFADSWREFSLRSEPILEAFEETGVMTWPEDDVAAQGRFLDIEDEVTERVFDEIRSAAAEAFVSIANEILVRERLR